MIIKNHFLRIPFISLTHLIVMSSKIAFFVILLIIPLFTVCLTSIEDASADKSDGKSCPSKDKSGKNSSSYSSKMSMKLAKKSLKV